MCVIIKAQAKMHMGRTGMSRQTRINGKKVALLRRALSLTQGQLQEYSGVDRGLISNIERGVRVSVTFDTLNKLAAGLKVDPLDLLDTTGDIRPVPKTDQDIIEDYLEQYP